MKTIKQTLLTLCLLLSCTGFILAQDAPDVLQNANGLRGEQAEQGWNKIKTGLARLSTIRGQLDSDVRETQDAVSDEIAALLASGKTLYKYAWPSCDRKAAEQDAAFIRRCRHSDETIKLAAKEVVKLSKLVKALPDNLHNKEIVAEIKKGLNLYDLATQPRTHE